jgi:hypothetical protein
MNDEQNLTSTVNEETVSTGRSANVSEDKVGNYRGARLIINLMATEVSRLAKSNDKEAVRKMTEEVLATVFTMCAADEYAVGIFVGDRLYRYDDYAAPTAIGNLLVAKRVSVSDSPSSVDFLDRSKYNTGIKALEPGSFASNIKTICSKLRTNPNIQQLSRPSYAAITEAVPNAVVGDGVSSLKQVVLYYLKTKFDDCYDIAVAQWCKANAVSLFS